MCPFTPVNAAWRIELVLGNKADLIEIGKKKQSETLKQNAPVLSQNDKTAPSAPFPDDDDVDDDEWPDDTNCPKCGCDIYQWTPQGKICRQCVPFTPAPAPPPKHDTRKQLAVAAGVSSAQRACVAVEADEFRQELAATVEAQRRAKISEARTAAEAAKKEESEPELIPEIEADEQEQGQEITQLIESSPPARNTATADAKTAAAFNTNRTYVNQAANLREKSPAGFGWRAFSRSMSGGGN